MEKIKTSCQVKRAWDSFEGKPSVVKGAGRGKGDMTDAVLKHEGLKVLNDRLGPVEMERFLVLMSREQTGYTEWHKAQDDTLTVREYSKRAMEHQKNGRFSTQTGDRHRNFG